MNKAKGKLELEYKGKKMVIEFTLNIAPGYGGLPMMTIKDKNNHHHSFTRGSNGEWRSMVTLSKWTTNFIDLLLVLFEEKYQEYKLNIEE